MTYSIFGSRIKARAIATLCFWPPDNMTPLEPTTVSRPAGREIYLMLDSSSKITLELTMKS